MPLEVNDELKIHHALRILRDNPQWITVRGRISTRKAASLVRMSHHTLNRSKEWKAALDEYENTRPDRSGNQADVPGDSSRME